MHFIKGVSLMALMRCWWLVSGASVCLSGDFDSQVESALNNEMLSSAEIRDITNTFDELQDILRTRWNGAHLFNYGSLLTGLGAKTSDIDFYLQIPQYNNTADVYIVRETAKVLSERPEKYSDVVLKLDQIVPIITFYDKALQRHVDLSFRSSSGLENTNLIAYYLNLDDRHIPLAAIIKLWCKIHHLTGTGLLPNYAIYLMIAFYLQQKNMVPPGYEIQALLPARYVNNWNVNFEKLPCSVKNNETLYELLGGFFKFYDDFNFSENCISPFAGRAVAKKDFKNLSFVPKEFIMYVTNLNMGSIKPLPVDTAICIQDIFEHNTNVVKRVDRVYALKFKDHLKITAQKFNELSSDKFLSSILMKYKHKESIAAGKNYEVCT